MLLDFAARLSQFFRACAVSAVLVAPCVSAAVSVDFKDFDKRDIDILVGDFSSLVVAFQKFATDENSILEQRIDQVFDRFDHSMTCAIDQTMAKAQNTLGRSIPDFKIFRTDEVEYCQDTQVLRPNVGVLDRARLERCIVRRLLVQKPVPFEGVSSAYSGLKEYANAAYCGARGSEGTAEYELSKDYFSHASIMTEVYDDISELEGCEQSSPKKLFECTSRYYDAMVKRLKAYFPLDQKNADYAALAELREAMTPPATTRKWLFFTETILTVDQLDDYEALSAELRRNFDVAELNKAKRLREYERKVVETIAEIDKQKTVISKAYIDLRLEYSSCDFVEGKYRSSFPANVVKPLEANAQVCRKAIASGDYSDLITEEQKKWCDEEAPVLISTANSYVARMKSDCDESGRAHGRRVEERNLRQGAL